MGKYTNLVEKTLSDMKDVEKLAKKFGGKKTGKNTYLFDISNAGITFSSAISKDGYFEAMATDSKNGMDVEVTEVDFT